MNMMLSVKCLALMVNPAHSKYSINNYHCYYYLKMYISLSTPYLKEDWSDLG